MFWFDILNRDQQKSKPNGGSSNGTEKEKKRKEEKRKQRKRNWKDKKQTQKFRPRSGGAKTTWAKLCPPAAKVFAQVKTPTPHLGRNFWPPACRRKFHSRGGGETTQVKLCPPLWVEPWSLPLFFLCFSLFCSFSSPLLFLSSLFFTFHCIL